MVPDVTPYDVHNETLHSGYHSSVCVVFIILMSQLLQCSVQLASYVICLSVCNT